MTTKLIKARRTVERMRLQADGAGKPELAIWDASQKVVDLEAVEQGKAVRTARIAGRAMDAGLLIVALLTMSFSLQNIHDFAHHHAVQDPIAWFVAPAVDLALIAALLGDAVLSRWQLNAGPWATRLRWYTGAATVVLNSWEAWAQLDAAAILLHTSMPVLLFVLAEAASPYRHQFAETVKKAAGQVDTSTETANPIGMSTPTEAGVDTAPATLTEAPEAEVDERGTKPAVSTGTSQVSEPAPLRSVPTRTRGDKLSADSARKAIETAWEAGLTVREAAVEATRATSYVGRVYAQLTKTRGPQPSKGQIRIDVPDAA